MGDFSFKFWGVRGSVPAPDPKTVTYGGNTSCVEVRVDGQLIVLDMGSGLRPLGDALTERPLSGAILISHYHWDHIQGLPFFGPIYDPRCSFEIFGATRGDKDARELLAGQMVSPYFPVPLETFRAKLSFRTISGGETLQIGAARVVTRELHHPNGVLGYRIEHDGRSLVYATDNEHVGGEPDDALVELARGADALIYDAMYTADEYEGKRGVARRGWGHSTWESGTAAATAAGVKQLVLFHHDPGRSDQDLESILGVAQQRFANTKLAREREQIVL